MDAGVVHADLVGELDRIIGSPADSRYQARSACVVADDVNDGSTS